MFFDTDEIMKQFDEICETLDCGDSSCIFKKKNKYGVYGMRTNGGCRCLNALSPRQGRTIRKLLQMLMYNKEHTQEKE